MRTVEMNTVEMNTVDAGAQTPPAQSGTRTCRSTRVAAVSLLAGFAGFGAGAVDLAISSSLLVSPAGAAGLPAVAAGVAAALWGTALLVWTVLALHRGRLPGIKPAMALLAAASLAHAAGAAAAPAVTPGALPVSQLAALLLSLMILAASGWLHRHNDGIQAPHRGDPAPPPQAGRLLLAAFAGAVLVAGIATPGLAASTAGQFAVPHGSHGTPGSGPGPDPASGSTHHGH